MLGRRIGEGRGKENSEARIQNSEYRCRFAGPFFEKPLVDVGTAGRWEGRGKKEFRSQNPEFRMQEPLRGTFFENPLSMMWVREPQ